MENNAELIAQCVAKAEKWLTPSFDESTRADVQAMLDKADKTDLIECFYKDLEFGTGGLRGIMGAGSNRMNIYTVGMATQGFANYLKKNFAQREEIAVVVCHDCRNNSRLYAETVADIFSANGIKVYLFDDMRPTPECSFAIRHLGCQAGVNITASHNPREYNGYKAYWEDGAQVLAPHDTGIIDEVNNKFNEITTSMNNVMSNILALENNFATIKDSAGASSKAVESTDGIVKAIENASTQLTLIGFNASIEAKRAGAAGAGFNVIAQEVRTLADKNTKQANEVENTLNEIKKSIVGINAQLKTCNSEIQQNAEVIEKLKTLVDEANVQVKNLK